MECYHCMVGNQSGMEGGGGGGDKQTPCLDWLQLTIRRETYAL